MSNTATVTPYADTAAEASVSTPARDVVSWLCAPPSAAVVQARERARHATPRAVAADTIRRAQLEHVELQATTPDSLLATAQHQGYRMRRRAGQVFLEHPASRTRLAIETTSAGTLLRHVAGAGRSAAQALVRQNTVDRTVAHLQARGMRVEGQTAHGELRMTAVEQGGQEQARIDARIDSDGTLHVDVSGVRGGRCDTLVNDLAHAVGGRITDQQFKPARFQPGEPARVPLRGKR